MKKISLEPITSQNTMSLVPESSAGDSNDHNGEYQLFDSRVWTEPLHRFAKATGLSISLYDRFARRQSEVMTSGPIGERFSKSGFWQDESLGSKVDQEAVLECILLKQPIYSVQLEMFSHLAMPLMIDDELSAVVVVGWLPDRFAEPVNCNLVAKRIGADPMEIWQLMRMQQPISREKLETQAQMLATFAGPLLHQLIVRDQERKRAIRSKIVSETGLTFAESTTEKQICVAAFASLCRLVPAIAMTIEILKNENEMEEAVQYSQTWPQKREAEYEGTSLHTHWTLPILAAQGRPLGRIEMTLIQAVAQLESIHSDSLSQEIKDDVLLIVGQFGIALQKVRLIQTLEQERSALKGANTQLQHLHKMKDEFLATVSHELRTPLNAVLGWSQMLREEGPEMPDFMGAISTIERNAKNQLHLIEDLLDVSRVISGKMTLVREDIEATALLKQSIETVYPMIEARRQKVHTQISTTPLPLKGDATRVTQIFWNLLSNASKFTPEGGHISVVLENAGHYFKLVISDSGKGIPAEFLPHLFDRFSQADGSFTRRHGGLGLGLAIVRHLVELHGGTVSAASEGDGKGSTFTVYLPQNTTDLELDNAETFSRAQQAGSTTPFRPLKGQKILLIDDEPDSLRLARFVLEKHGALVETTDSAAEGFQKLKEWQPDILISDISMPDESGYELIRRIRFLSPSEGGQIPAVALTALASQEKKELALSSGFQLHMTKPLEPNVLLEALVDLIANVKDGGTVLLFDAEETGT